jgi:hypothetical protein
MLKIIARFISPRSANPIEGSKTMTTVQLAIIILVAAGIFFGLAWWMKSSADRDNETIKLFNAIGVIAAVAAVVMLATGVQNLS